MGKLAIPIAFQNILSTSANLVDTAMITRLGDAAVASVNAAGRWTFFVSMVFFGMASGCSVLISQYWGAKEEDNIHRTYGIALFCSVTLSLIYTVIAMFFSRHMISVYVSEPELIELGSKYLRIVALGIPMHAYAFTNSVVRRSVEDVKTPVLISVVGMLANICGNYIFIYGKLGFPEMGLSGAAASTALSFVLQAVIYLIVGRAQRHFTYASPKKLFAFDKEFLKSYFRIASPVLINEVLWAIATNGYVAIYGKQGTSNYAGYSIYMSIQEISFVFFVGICNACAIMTGKAVGSGRPKQAYNTAVKFLKITPLLSILVGALLISIRHPILHLMSPETPESYNMAANLLLFFSFWLCIRNIPYICVVGIFRAGGDTKTAFFMDVGVMYFISLPTVWLLANVVHAPFFLIVVGMYLSEDIPKTIICLRHFFSRRWIRQLTRSGDNTYLEEQEDAG